jgi:putative SOS response-associated peptidase YedK
MLELRHADVADERGDLLEGNPPDASTPNARRKHPIHFHLPGYDVFAFAGLSTSRTDETTGEIVESCTIITTTPNELVAPVHDRMPVIIPAAAEATWLDPEIAKDHALSISGRTGRLTRAREGCPACPSSQPA